MDVGMMTPGVHWTCWPSLQHGGETPATIVFCFRKTRREINVQQLLRRTVAVLRARLKDAVDEALFLRLNEDPLDECRSQPWSRGCAQQATNRLPSWWRRSPLQVKIACGGFETDGATLGWLLLKNVFAQRDL